MSARRCITQGGGCEVLSGRFQSNSKLTRVFLLPNDTKNSSVPLPLNHASPDCPDMLLQVGPPAATSLVGYRRSTERTRSATSCWCPQSEPMKCDVGLN